MTEHTTKIIGHRGAPIYEPENTIESFKKAIEFGVAFVECDVHLTKDGKIVVIHDPTLERTTNGTGFVKDYTLEELQKLNIGNNYKIPTLEEVLRLNYPLVVEFKAFNPPGKSYDSGSLEREIYPDIVKKVVKEIETSEIKDIIMVSFDKRYLAELNNHPELKKALISRPFPDLNKIKKLNLFGLAVEYHSLNKENINEAYKNNLKVLAWTIDNEQDIEKMANLKIDFIASNDPKLAMEVVKRLKT